MSRTPPTYCFVGFHHTAGTLSNMLCGFPLLPQLPSLWVGAVCTPTLCMRNLRLGEVVTRSGGSWAGRQTRVVFSSAALTVEVSLLYVPVLWANVHFLSVTYDVVCLAAKVLIPRNVFFNFLNIVPYICLATSDCRNTCHPNHRFDMSVFVFSCCWPGNFSQMNHFRWWYHCHHSRSAPR